MGEEVLLLACSRWSDLSRDVVQGNFSKGWYKEAVIHCVHTQGQSVETV
jgi:hypothetical protein